ncbi:peptidase U32 [Photobacterium jeanii]|uniref:Peptidase U32 n=1 Tax=Photobacterium jeanii TaxID=858640 RepID=A0A178K2M8_9GAMM|nr:U32 family peptidase [Photobacterium jeanii]OAN11560.1 peptidase U32 [Photobacterium jeanii]PST91082.1 U32 family peptidase [Photobacterium jeanii]
MSSVSTRNQFELLAPGGDLESIKAAIIAGADAIYCGLDNFNARNRATNLTFDNLNGIVRLAHEHNCKIFLTLNIIILESEIPALVRLLNKLVNTKIDGVIVQDLGLFYILKHHFPTLDVHASTQNNTHNEGQIAFLSKLTASRVNLSRELNIHEIKHLATVGRDEHNVLMEVFVHGSYCIGFSGLCYISSVKNGNSGNRGRCSQPCRDKYQTTNVGKDYPLNLKDNSAFSDMEALADAGVYSLKVEGRIKKSHYVYTVVDQWNQQIQRYCDNQAQLTDTSSLYTVFNRDFSNAYLQGNINKNMFIDNPRDNSVKHFSEVYSCTSEDKLQEVKQELYDKKTTIIETVDDKIRDLSIEKLPLHLSFRGQVGEPLVIDIKAGSRRHTVTSNEVLVYTDTSAIDHDALFTVFKAVSDYDHDVATIDDSDLADNVFMPFSVLKELRDQLNEWFRDGREWIAPIDTPQLEKTPLQQEAAKLSVLIANPKDIEVCKAQGVEIHYQLPDSLHTELKKLDKLFTEYRESSEEELVPWFPAILIGEHFEAAKAFLAQVKPKRIVTNNTGVAYVASQMGIEWIAGPLLNMTNSFGLHCIKEEFNAAGAFVSNEINKKQIKHIVRPQSFDLYYSIYHPIVMLMSRQCLFHQTVGCKIKAFDAKCLKGCKKSTSILTMRDAAFIIDKQKGDHNALYSQNNFLNTAIIDDLAGKFSHYFIDLRDIETQTHVAIDKAGLLAIFSDLVAGKEEAKQQLRDAVTLTSDAQYHKGL